MKAKKEKKEKKFCPTCGARMDEYPHVLTAGLVAGLAKLVAVGRAINIKRLGLTHNQWANFQKLRYWGLVEAVDVDGDHKKGVWRATEYGRAFVAGRAMARRRVRTYRGKVLELEGDSVEIGDLDPSYRLRPDYLAGATTHDDQEMLEL